MVRRGVKCLFCRRFTDTTGPLLDTASFDSVCRSCVDTRIKELTANIARLTEELAEYQSATLGKVDQ